MKCLQCWHVQTNYLLTMATSKYCVSLLLFWFVFLHVHYELLHQTFTIYFPSITINQLISFIFWQHGKGKCLLHSMYTVSRWLNTQRKCGVHPKNLSKWGFVGGLRVWRSKNPLISSPKGRHLGGPILPQNQSWLWACRSAYSQIISVGYLPCMWSFIKFNI